MGHRPGHLARGGVARDHHAAAAARLAEHLVGRHVPDRLAALQAPEVRPLLHAELARPRLVEAARARSSSISA